MMRTFTIAAVGRRNFKVKAKSLEDAVNRFGKSHKGWKCEQIVEQTQPRREANGNATDSTLV